MARTYRKRKKTNMYTIAKKVVNSTLKKRMEVKKFYTNGSHSVLTSGVLAIPLEGIAFGTGANDRIGDRLNVLSMNMRMNWENGDPNNTVRILCVETYDTYVPTTAVGLFNPVTTPFVGTINSQVNRQIVKRVLYDKTFNLNPNYSGASKFKYAKGYVKFGKDGKHIQYVDGVTAPSEGHIMWAFVSDSIIAPSPRLQYALETRYIDN